MTRDYVHYTRKRQRQTRRGLVLALVLVFSALLPGLMYYMHRQDLTVASFKEKTKEELAVFFPNLNHSAKVLAAQKAQPLESEVPKPIHFNFYDELPKAQLDTAQKAALEDEETVDEPPTTKPIANKTPPAPLSSPAPQVSKRQEAVVQELAKELSSMKSAETIEASILQISVFHSLDAAKRYRAALASAGLQVDLVTSRVGKKVIYRLQQGPYRQLESLKLAKKRFNERGIACEIRKLPP